MQKILLGVLIILTVILYNGLTDLNKNIKELVKVVSPEYIQEIPTDYIGD